MHQRPPTHVRVLVSFVDPHIKLLYIVNTVYFYLLQVKNKPREGAMTGHLLLGLLATLQTIHTKRPGLPGICPRKVIYGARQT